jgi:hypothetical protein
VRIDSTRSNVQGAIGNVPESLTTLRRHPAFQARELDRCAALAKENRAVTNSYLAGAIEAAETAEAGRRYRKRRLQEKKDEQD